MKKLAFIFCLALAFAANLRAQFITSQPQSLTINYNSTATFTVGATNATNYQWQFNSIAITNATNSVLTLENVATNQAGTYSVLVNNSEQSSNAILTLIPGTIVTFTFTNLLNASSSNIQVQLFNHDKPVTVQNFLHYVTSGAYTNMFVDRCIPGFVLQTGDYGASDQTNTLPPITGWFIDQQFTLGDSIEPPFPAGLNNEYATGPLIHNRTGTIAMALQPNKPNSGNSAFFFNLADNSGAPNNLDSQNFTVFGQIISGTNLLAYFNNLTNGGGLNPNGEIIFGDGSETNPLPNLLVNDASTNPPANSDLVFCGFTLLQPPGATNLPGVVITSPTANTILDNSTNLILTVEGSAVDVNNIGLASVRCDLIPLPAADGTLPNGGMSLTNYILGSNNWSMNVHFLPPGMYKVGAQVQDEAGNLSQEVFVQPVIITAIAVIGNGTVTFTDASNMNVNAVGYPFQNGTTNAVFETPGSSEVFVDWLAGGHTSSTTNISFTMGPGALITANFAAPTNIPLQLAIVGPGTVSGATNGQLFEQGATFLVTAIPNPGQSFYAWNTGTALSLEPVQTFTMASVLSIKALFVTNNVSNLVAFTYPEANGIVGTNALDVTGTLSNAPSALVSCQIFSATTLDAVTEPQPVYGTNTWEIGFTGLPIGSYILLTTADGPNGSSFISEDFSVAYAAGLTVIVVGNGSVSLVTNGEVLPIGTNFMVTATPANGNVFYSWNNGTQISTNTTQSNTMASGLTLTATFVPSNTAKGITITYPAARAVLTTNKFTLKGKIAATMKSARITCQFFQTNGIAVGSLLTTRATNTWSIPVANLPGGNYIVEATATNEAGKSTVVSQPFYVLAFAAVQGTYNGLFICTNGTVAPTNSGSLTFTLTPSGAMTGKLNFPAYGAVPIYSLPFDNIAFQTGFTEFSTTNFHGQPLLGVIYVDLNDGTDVAYGTVSSSNWSSQLVCYRAVKTLSTASNPAVGDYVISLPPQDNTNGAGANGYASVTVAKNGALTVSGALPDNTTFTQSTTVSQNGVWPLYAIPSGVKTNGMLLGWGVFSNSASSGQLYWYKAAGVGSYYTNGIGTVSNMLLNSAGTNYSRPASGSEYSIIFTGGSIIPALTNSLTVNNAGQFVVSGGSSDALKIRLSNGGVITGTIRNPTDHATLKFSGVFISPAQGGSGFVPEAGGEVGVFTLQP